MKFLKIINRHFTIRKNKVYNKSFKLPKHELSQEKIFEKDMDNPYSNLYNEFRKNEQDDISDIYEKLKKKEQSKAETKISQFFSNLSNKDSIKLTENILERIRLSKEIKYDEDFKQKYNIAKIGKF